MGMTLRMVIIVIHRCNHASYFFLTYLLLSSCIAIIMTIRGLDGGVGHGVLR